MATATGTERFSNGEAKIIKDVVKKSMSADAGRLDYIPRPTGNSPEYDEVRLKMAALNESNKGYSLSETLHMTHCPDCGNPVEHEGGCVICKHCGFSKCG